MQADTKDCPMCGETIKAVALKCRFCNSDLATMQAEVERELFTGHPAMIYSVGQIVPFVLVAAAAIAIGVLSNSGSGVLAALAFFVIGCVAVAVFFYVKSLSTYYRITTQRIKLERGLLSKVEESLEIFRVDHFEYRRPFAMRILDQSSLHLFSSDAELGRFSIYAVPNLATLAETLRNCQLRERTRRGLTTFVKA